MVWPFSRGSEVSAADSSTPRPKRSSERKREDTPQPKEQQLLLEDTEPRFNNGPANPNQLPIQQAMDRITVESFTLSSLAKMPCFREAGLTGLSAMGVLGMVVFLVQKSPSKAANWAVGGLLLGSTVSWEQCRSKRRKEFAFTAQARETVAAKEKPMLNKPGESLGEEKEKNRETVKSWWNRG